MLLLIKDLLSSLKTSAFQPSSISTVSGPEVNDDMADPVSGRGSLLALCLYDSLINQSCWVLVFLRALSKNGKYFDFFKPLKLLTSSLGINLTAKHKGLFHGTYLPVWCKIRKALNKLLGEMEMSWMGRISTMKVSIVSNLWVFYSSVSLSSRQHFKGLACCSPEFQLGKYKAKGEHFSITQAIKDGWLEVPNVIPWCHTAQW